MALILLLLTNMIMGMTLTAMEKKTLREQIEQRMLDIANVASAQVNGDELKTITPKDRNNEIYQRTYNTLHTFQNNIELEYIYLIAPLDDGTFTFGIDPDEEDPGKYGELIETTDALKNAAKGTPDVDKTPHSDDWGRFYSAYSPIMDSQGNVIAIVGVDFDADWYDEKMNTHKAAGIILTMVALTIGIVLSFVIMSQNRKRFIAMLKSIDELDKETKKLDDIIMQSSVKKLDMLPNENSSVLKTLAAGESMKAAPVNEYDEVHTSIEAVYNKLQKYLKYVDSEVYTDDTTGVYNKAAYKKRICELDEQIAKGEADFSVAFFDINGIKKIYTHHGFEAGEKLMYECALLLMKVFGKENVYHITGDEFIVLIDGKSKFDMEDYFTKLDIKLDKYNKDHVMEHPLSVSKGSATYDSNKYDSYRKTFIAAEARCKKDKDDFYGRVLT